ncbi:Katanin p80 WD40 repeat-containing subunit B1 [Quaeritorhiza haematococci]|nr:Katanin p80 WD40 repeat-containing subunit B1 [Quaeritorhiza haematococci]
MRPPVRIHNFVAHNTTVNCLRIGPQSGRVMVTGGDDSKVNVWAIGKTSPILSLQGHASPVTCAAMDWPEEIVVAGASSGTVKLWDLEHAKDNTVKIWDVRRKGCIQTYQGHQDDVKVMRITPDGRWIATGGKDSSLKIWDMTAGKLLKSFSDHTAPVISLAFSPYEFLLATLCADKTLRLYDLQTFECISSTDKLSGKPYIVDFHPSGEHIVTVCVNSMQLWTWEPMVCTEVVNTDWYNIVDIKIVPEEEQFLGGSLDQNFVSVWGCDLRTKAAEDLSDVARVSDASTHGFNDLDGSPHHVSQTYEVPQSSDVFSSVSALKNEFNGLSLRPQSRDSRDAPFNSTPKSAARKESLVPVSNGDRPVNLDIAKFLPGTQGKKAQYSSSMTVEFDHQQGATYRTETDVIDAMLARHTSMVMILKNRLRNIRDVRSAWDEPGQGVRKAVQTMIQLGDMAVVVDVLRLLTLKPKLLTLEICAMLLPVLNDLLADVYEDYIVTACHTIRILLRSFSNVIMSTVEAAGRTTYGVDISGEER